VPDKKLDKNAVLLYINKSRELFVFNLDGTQNLLSPGMGELKSLRLQVLQFGVMEEYYEK
jgi:hypothetical protein